MELQQLQHFVAVARTGNIGRAADELHITHSGLSRSIKSLEDFLNLHLFRRMSRGVVITAFGEALLPRAIHILNEREKAVAELEALRAMRAGHVEVALHPIFDEIIGAEVITAFSRRFPAIELDVWSGADPELTNRVIEGEFDFAFTLFSALREEQLLSYERLFALPVGVYASPSYPEPAGTLELEALLEAQWVLLGASAFRRTFDRLFREMGVAPPQRMRQVSSMALFRTIVAEGRALTVLPRVIAESRPDVFRPVRSIIPEQAIEGGILLRRDAHHSLPTLSLIEAFREGARAFG